MEDWQYMLAHYILYICKTARKDNKKMGKKLKNCKTQDFSIFVIAGLVSKVKHFSFKHVFSITLFNTSLIASMTSLFIKIL